jgi:repressor LexA
MGWASPNAAAEHVNALKRKGYITVARGAARGIALVEDGNEQDAVSIIHLLDGDGTPEHAILWLESRGVKL